VAYSPSEKLFRNPIRLIPTQAAFGIAFKEKLFPGSPTCPSREACGNFNREEEHEIA
jgi:hypothetical protein